MSSQSKNDRESIPTAEDRSAATSAGSNQDGDSEAMYDLIESCLTKLEQAGPMDQVSALLGFLPPETDSDARHFVLIELIKLDMAMAAEQGELRPIHLYQTQLGDALGQRPVPLDLLMEEMQLANEFGLESRAELSIKTCQDAAAVEDSSRQGDGSAQCLGNDLLKMVGRSEADAAPQQPTQIPDQQVGDRIDDFLIIRKLGQGAFAHVYLARQLSMHRLVALKISRGRGDEPRALAQFDHPNIVRVFDQRAIAPQNLHLLYMQYQPGGTLAEVVRLVRSSDQRLRGSTLLDSVDRHLLAAAHAVPEDSSVRRWLESAPWPTVTAWIGVQLARALDASHQRGVMHRDVKPANVLLSAEGIPKLADFNVSDAGAAGGAGASAAFGGSIGYMSPEHLSAIREHASDHRESVRQPADIYSLAVLLWELWQGRRPFECQGTAESWNDAVHQQSLSRSRPLRQPHRVGSASEQVLEETLRAALAHASEDRLATSGEMAARLRLALHPQAADLFYPGANTFRGKIVNLSPYLVIGTIVVIPHLVAAFFHYQYNYHQTMQSHPLMQQTLRSISPGITAIAFLLTFLLAGWYARRVQRSLGRAANESAASDEDLGATLDVGPRAAILGGSGWLVAAVAFCIVLQLTTSGFTTTRLAHFFMSFLICGGVAMIYPFFGLSLATTGIYYPRLVRNTMRDENFDLRSATMLRQCVRYLLLAALIPLMGAALLISGESASRSSILLAIGSGFLGICASFYAYLAISRTWDRLADVLSKRTSSVPGEEQVL